MSIELNGSNNPDNPNRILSIEEATSKARENHLRNLEQAMAQGDNETAHLYFYNLCNHLEKYKKIYGLTDEQTGIDLWSIAKKVALFYLECAKRINGKSGVNDNLKWFEVALKKGELSYNDLGVTVEEIESLKPKI